MTTSTTSSGPRQKRRRSGSSRHNWVLLVSFIASIGLLLLAAVLIISLGLRRWLSGRSASPGMPVEVVKLTATPTVSGTGPTPTASAPVVPPLPSNCETIIGSGDVQVAAPLPISLTIGTTAIPVVPISSPDTWSEAFLTSPYTGTAVWVCGTVVNYVVGLEPTPENDSLLSGLRPGDELKLYLSNGAGLLFRFAERRETAADDTSVFSQMRPRLTVILEQADGSRHVATADYVSEIESAQPSETPSVQVGQPVRVGGAQVTVQRGHAEQNVPDLFPGTMYYLVEFQVENVGEISLKPQWFQMQLRDAVGNVYLPVTDAGELGEYGTLSDELAPGAVGQGSVGYLVPQAMTGPLVWTFAPQPGSSIWASVSIPYQAGEVEPAPTAAQAEVTITDAFLSAGGDLLVIEGEVRNTGGQQLVVKVDDISLSSSAGMSALRSAAPPLPWEIAPGQTQIIELQYEKPDASTALLSLLGYSFEIRGIP